MPNGWRSFLGRHVKVLGQGVEVWNQWRHENPNVEPLLINVSLPQDLAGANLSRANLERANLNHADLTEANLNGARLHAASLLGVDMAGATLRGATLTATNVNGDLRRVDLGNANLHGANIYGSRVGHARFAGAQCGSTVLAALDLSTCLGLEEVKHNGPSTIGVDTIFYSNGKIPPVFLRGAGVPEGFIADLDKLVAADVQGQFYSCFISYSHADKMFVRRLRERLKKHHIQSYLDERKMLPGDHIETELERGINSWDMLLICCSKHSLNSRWVEFEVNAAREKEKRLSQERGRSVHSIIPIDLDGYISSAECQSAWARELQTRIVSDFKGADRDVHKLDARIDELVLALRSDEAVRGRPPQPILGS
jgi:hypothetical protein